MTVIEDRRMKRYDKEKQNGRYKSYLISDYVKCKCIEHSNHMTNIAGWI